MEPHIRCEVTDLRHPAFDTADAKTCVTYKIKMIFTQSRLTKSKELLSIIFCGHSDDTGRFCTLL